MLQRVWPHWRQKLKTTQWPVLRQLVQLARLGVRLRRLGQTQALVEQLHDRCGAIERVQADLLALCTHLQHHSEQTPRLGTHMLEAIQKMELRVPIKVDEIYAQLDLIKSAQEVPAEWFDEYRLWRKNNPIPARPLVSICVATYNRSRLLVERCLASLQRQTYRHVEIIVVGDCCTDDTAQRVAALRDSRIRFVNLPQRGPYPDEPMRRWMVAGSFAMNQALSLCTGYFVTHLDDDDEHEPDRVEKLLAFARQDDLDFVWHPFWVEASPGRWVINEGTTLRYGWVTTSSIFYRRWLARITWDVQAHLLDEAGDWNRIRKFKYLGVKAARFPQPLLRHYLERTQIKSAA